MKTGQLPLEVVCKIASYATRSDIPSILTSFSGKVDRNVVHSVYLESTGVTQHISQIGGGDMEIANTWIELMKKCKLAIIQQNAASFFYPWVKTDVEHWELLKVGRNDDNFRKYMNELKSTGKVDITVEYVGLDNCHRVVSGQMIQHQTSILKYAIKYRDRPLHINVTTSRDIQVRYLLASLLSYGSTFSMCVLSPDLEISFYDKLSSAKKEVDISKERSEVLSEHELKAKSFIVGGSYKWVHEYADNVRLALEDNGKYTVFNNVPIRRMYPTPASGDDKVTVTEKSSDEVKLGNKYRATKDTWTRSWIRNEHEHKIIATLKWYDRCYQSVNSTK